MNVLPVYLSVYLVCALCLQRSEIGIKFPGAGVTDASELLCVFWELKPCLLQCTQCS